MNDKELERILRGLGSEKFAPSPSLVRLTKARMRGRRLIQIAAILSLVMQIVVLGLVIYALTSPDVHPAAKFSGAVSLIAWAGAIAVVIVGARGHVSWFFRRVECLLS
jgi:hypothetical protein